MRHPLVGAATIIILLSAIASAEEFRIETKIFTGENEKPVNETVTLFQDGVVYDFLDVPPQIAVFRKLSDDRPGRFIILAVDHELRTELTTNRIEELMDKLRRWAARQKDPFLQFAANPDFDETFEPEQGELILASHVQSYRLKTERAGHPEAVAEYREFLDWYTRLNTLLQAGPPPQPRLAVNEALARHEVVPLSVELTSGHDQPPIRAEHRFTWRLSKEDHARINEVQRLLTTYTLVDNEEFLRRTRAAESDQ